MSVASASFDLKKCRVINAESGDITGPGWVDVLTVPHDLRGTLHALRITAHHGSSLHYYSLKIYRGEKTYWQIYTTDRESGADTDYRGPEDYDCGIDVLSGDKLAILVSAAIGSPRASATVYIEPEIETVESHVPLPGYTNAEGRHDISEAHLLDQLLGCMCYPDWPAWLWECGPFNPA